MPSGGLRAESGANFMINNNTNNKHYDETHRSVAAVAASEGPPKGSGREAIPGPSPSRPPSGPRRRGVSSAARRPSGLSPGRVRGRAGRFGNVWCGVREEEKREREEERGQSGAPAPRGRATLARGGRRLRAAPPHPEPDELLPCALIVARPGRGQGLREAGGERGLQAGLAGAKFKFRGSPERTWRGDARVGPPAPTSAGTERG